MEDLQQAMKRWDLSSGRASRVARWIRRHQPVFKENAKLEMESQAETAYYASLKRPLLARGVLAGSSWA